MSSPPNFTEDIPPGGTFGAALFSAGADSRALAVKVPI